jgi:glycosyltransferase involved in cell wall biosynthesis
MDVARPAVVVNPPTSFQIAMTDRIKILFTIPNFVTAGSGAAMMNIIERLDKDLFEPAVCVSRRGGRLADRVRELGLNLIVSNFTVPAKPYHRFLAQARDCAQHFKPYRFNLWHSFHYLDDYSEPIIARLSGAKAWIYTKKNMNWHQNAWHVRSLLATHIIAQNNDMLRQFFDRWPYRNKVKLIPRGVDTTKFGPGNGHQMDLQSQLGIPKDDLMVGCVANLVPVKGHPTLIEAVATLENVHLLFAGRVDDARYKSQLEEQIRNLNMTNRVHFLGSVADVPAFLQKMDVVSLPTWNKWRKEGCPVALLEAMACEKACIASNIPGVRDIIRDGENGRMVPPEDPPALSTAITQLALNPDYRNQLGLAARKTIIENFSIEKEVKAHEMLYTAVLNR